MEASLAICHSIAPSKIITATSARASARANFNKLAFVSLPRIDEWEKRAPETLKRGRRCDRVEESAATYCLGKMKSVSSCSVCSCMPLVL